MGITTITLLEQRVRRLENDGGGGGGPELSDDTPEAPGVADPGDTDEASRSNHVHPLQDVSAKLDANAPIAVATKTKITYDADGLVTAGTDAAFTDITGTITDAQHGNRSGGSLHPAAGGGASGFMTDAQVTKLAGIATGATAEVDADIGTAGRTNLLDQEMGLGVKGFAGVKLRAGTPSAPASGATLHGVAKAVTLPAQRLIGSVRPQILQPIFGTVRTMGPRTADTFGMTATNSNATNTGVTVDSTDIRRSISRATQTSAGTAGATVSFGATTPAAASGAWWLGNATGLGGFLCYMRFCFSTIPATRRWACGFRKVNSDPGSTNVNPSAAVNWFGIGCDASDTNVQFMHNDASGTATKNTGSVTIAMPTTAEIIECWFYSAPNSQTVQMSYEHLNGVAGPSTYTASSDLPSNTTFFMPFIMANNATTASAIAFDSMTIWISSDF